MNPEAQKALEESIKKWEYKLDLAKTRNYANVENFSMGTKDCPLCKVYLKDSQCYGCPVFKETKQNRCVGSPYVKVLKAYIALLNVYDNPEPTWKDTFDETWGKFISAVKQEVEFLKSLREPEMKKKYDHEIGLNTKSVILRMKRVENGYTITTDRGKMFVFGSSSEFLEFVSDVMNSFTGYGGAQATAKADNSIDVDLEEWNDEDDQ